MLFSISSLRSVGGMRKVLKNKRNILEIMASDGLRFLICRIGIRFSLQPSSLCISSRLGFSRLTVGKFGRLMFLLPVAVGRGQQVLLSFQGPPTPTWRSGMTLYVLLKTPRNFGSNSTEGSASVIFSGTFATTTTCAVLVIRDN